MTSELPWYRWDGEDLILQLQIQPRASRDEIVGVHAGHLRIRLTAPPVDGRANETLLRYLADLFQVARSQVILIGGTKGRRKRVRIRSPHHLPAPLPLPRRM
ncbi:MAG: DUF167 family protein [Gammaproteobacteria bacterium]